jgi:hypothetical protein
MKSLALLLTSLGVVSLAAATGCASQRAPATARTEVARTEFPAPPRAQTHATLQPIGIAKAAEEKPYVSLQPEKTYLERIDPSGWSGASTPPNAIGGGPAAEQQDLKTDDNPYSNE